MTVFEPGTLVSVVTASLDAAAQAAPEWRGQILQLSPGRLAWSTEAFHTRHLQLAFTTWNLGVDLDLSPPADAVVLALFMPSRNLFRLARSPASTSDILALAPGEAFQLRSLGNGGMLTLAVDRQTLQQRTALKGCDILEARCDARLQLRVPGDGNPLMDQLMGLLEGLRSRPAQMGDANYLDRVEAAVIDAVVTAVERPSERDATAARHHFARRAEELLRAQTDEPIPLRQLCGRLGVTASSLHQGFLDCFGVSPKAYLRNLRLNGARRQLARPLAPDSVTEVALDWGFLHFSRFAQDYSKLFGETPSATLRRNRPRRPASAGSPDASLAPSLASLFPDFPAVVPSRHPQSLVPSDSLAVSALQAPGSSVRTGVGDPVRVSG